MRFKYNKGDRLGPNNILMIERLYKDNSGNWIGKFQCPDCNEPYVAKLDHIVQGKVHQRCPKCQSKIRSNKIIDLREHTFGELTPIKLLDKTDSEGGAIWLCRCSCGEICEASRKVLTMREKTSCGHARKRDITGQKFGKLTAIKPTNKRTSWDSGSSVIWECKCDCGNLVEVDAHSLIKGNTTSCGCIISKGENRIEEILIELDIPFQKQYTISGCVNPNTSRELKFDFYLLNTNILIEFDGIQHFQLCKGWDTEEKFNARQYRDNLKNIFCESNNYQLIRIPYWEYNNLNADYIQELLQVNKRGEVNEQ